MLPQPYGGTLYCAITDRNAYYVRRWNAVNSNHPKKLLARRCRSALQNNRCTRTYTYAIGSESKKLGYTTHSVRAQKTQYFVVYTVRVFLYRVAFRIPKLNARPTIPVLSKPCQKEIFFLENDFTRRAISRAAIVIVWVRRIRKNYQTVRTLFSTVIKKCKK